MATPRTTVQHVVLTCPACKQDVHGTLTVELEVALLPPEQGTAEVQASGKVTGLRVHHDCTPRATRDRGVPDA